MANILKTPYLDEIVISRDGREHILIRAVLSINRVHYIVYIPLLTRPNLPGDHPVEWEFDEGEFDEEDGFDNIEPTGFARLIYDYETLTAAIEPIHVTEEPGVIDNIMATLQRLTT